MSEGFLSLCCGYFETLSKLGYKSHQIILSSSDSRANGVERESASVEKGGGGFYCVPFIAVSLPKMSNGHGVEPRVDGVNFSTK